MKRFLTTAIILMSFSIGFAVTPYNERCDDFTAQFSANLSQSNDCFVFNYIIKYLSGNTGQLSFIKIYYLPNVYMQKYFVKYDGQTSDNREWVGYYFTSDSCSFFSFKPKRIIGDKDTDQIVIKNDHPFMMFMSTAFLNPGQSISIHIVTKINGIIPGIGTIGAAEAAVIWLYQDDEERGPDIGSGRNPKLFPTIIPMPRPGSAVEYATYLMEQTTTAKNLGMISSIDTFSVLWNRTMTIRAKALEGPKSYNIAIAELEQYRIQLGGQRGKTVNEDAFQVLDYVASEMIRLMK